jgi:hypothetical protein
MVSDALASMITKFLLTNFSSWFEGFKACSNPSGSFGRLGILPFSTISITLDYYNDNHRDLGNIDFGVSIWFCKGKLCCYISLPN